MKNPIALFEDLKQQETSRTNVRIPSACCLATIGLDGFPNARFISLKEIVEDSFVVTGSLASRKGLEISENENVALTFWWTATEIQVRVQGKATIISEALASQYFSERNKASKIVSTICKQGEILSSQEEILKMFEVSMKKNSTLEKPEQWSGWAIDPVRIEFLYFKETRLHERSLYVKEKEQWKHCFLAP